MTEARSSFWRANPKTRRCQTRITKQRDRNGEARELSAEPLCSSLSFVFRLVFIRLLLLFAFQDSKTPSRGDDSARDARRAIKVSTVWQKRKSSPQNRESQHQKLRRQQKKITRRFASRGLTIKQARLARFTGDSPRGLPKTRRRAQLLCNIAKHEKPLRHCVRGKRALRIALIAGDPYSKSRDSILRAHFWPEP